MRLFHTTPRVRLEKQHYERSELCECHIMHAWSPFVPVLSHTVRVCFLRPKQQRQRCWWNSSEGNKEYVGLSASIALIDHLFATQGNDAFTCPQLHFAQSHGVICIVATQAPLMVCLASVKEVPWPAFCAPFNPLVRCGAAMHFEPQPTHSGLAER
mgnify:CR=1 FL=1